MEDPSEGSPRPADQPDPRDDDGGNTGTGYLRPADGRRLQPVGRCFGILLGIQGIRAVLHCGQGQMTRAGQLGLSAGVALMVAALTGCAGSPPSSPLAAEVVQSSACVDSIEDQPAYAQLRLKSPALGEM